MFFVGYFFMFIIIIFLTFLVGTCIFTIKPFSSMLINVSYKHKVRDSFLIKIRALNCCMFTMWQTFIQNNCVCVSNFISTSKYALCPVGICFPPAPPLQPIPNKHQSVFINHLSAGNCARYLTYIISVKSHNNSIMWLLFSLFYQ